MGCSRTSGIIVSPKAGLHAIVSTNRNLGRAVPSVPSGRIRMPGLLTLGTFPLHPFAKICGAMHYLDAFSLAAIQEPNHFDVHQPDFAQIQNPT